jgi:hypothetical protein
VLHYHSESLILSCASNSASHRWNRKETFKLVFFVERTA